MPNEVFVETVSLVAQILIRISPPVETDEGLEVLRNGEVVLESQFTTYSLGMMLREAVNQLEQA